MDQKSIRVGSLSGISGEVNIAAGSIIKGYTAEQVSALLQQITTTFTPNPFTGRCPYKGLDPFEEEDAGLFFGRERLVEELVSRVKKTRAVFITGPSGSGKSSLVRAGLIPSLKGGALADAHSERWLYETMRPGRDPLGELARVTASLAGTLSAGEDIRSRGQTDATVLQQWCEIALKDNRTRRAVLFIDQFEEVFTQVGPEPQRLAFLNLLINAATYENGRVILLFSMRSDFVSNCAAYPALNALLNQQFLQIGAMQPEELVSAIAQPALRVGLRIDPDLIAQIINDMQGEPGALPLMQFALKDLFDANQSQTGVIALTLADYLQRGGIFKSLERHADSAFTRLNESEQALARNIFSGLVEVGPGSIDTRRTALLEELIPAGKGTLEVQAVIQKLADARLVTTDEQAGHDTLMISHEKLIDAWPWLKHLVEENRFVIALQNEITRDAKEWADHGKDPSYLYSGARLSSVNARLASNALVLSGAAQQYIQAARARQRRGQTMVMAGLGMLFAMLALAVIVFSSQSSANAQLAEQNGQIAQTAQAANTLSAARRETAQAASTLAVAQQLTAEAASTRADVQQRLALAQSQLARARELAAIAINQLTVDQDRSLLIALEASRTAHTLETSDALRRAVQMVKTKSVLSYCPQSSALVNGDTVLNTSYTFSYDQQFLAIYCANQDKIRVMRLSDNQALAEIDVVGGFIYGLNFSADGSKLTYVFRGPGGGDMSGTGVVWDIALNQEIFDTGESIGYGGFLSKDGENLWFTLLDDDFTYSKLVVYNTRTGQPVLTVHHATSIGVQGENRLFALAENVVNLYDIPSAESPAGARNVIHRFDMSTLENNPIDVDLDTRIVPVNETVATQNSWYVTYSGSELTFIDPKRIYPMGNVSVPGFQARSIAVMQNSTRFAYIEDQQIILRDWQDPSFVQVLAGHGSPVGRVEFSKDGLLLVSSSLDTTCRIWDAQTGALKTTINKTLKCRFAPDGVRLVLQHEDNSLSLWDTGNNGEVASYWLGQPVLSAWFTEDGGSVIMVSTAGAFAWNWREPAAVITPVNNLSALDNQHQNTKIEEASHDGRYRVTLSPTHELQVIDTTNQEILLKTQVTTDQVNSLRFSPDSARLILSFGSPFVSRVMADPGWPPFMTPGELDHTVGVWDLATLEKTDVLRGFNDAVNDASFSPESKYIVTASQDGFVRIFVANIEDLAALAQQRILRSPPELTCTERVQFLKEVRTCPTAVPERSPTNP